MSPAFISDPVFYALAIPGALLIGLSKSGFASGIGSLATPMLALAVTVPQAAAIMLPILCAADLMGLWALRRGPDWGVLRQLLPAGLVGIGLGWLGFGVLNPATVSGLVGAVTLGFLLLQWVRPPRADAPPPGPLQTGALAAFSGFTSFIAHAGGPPIAMALLPRRMEPLHFAATSAVFFTTINYSKWLPYGLLGLIDLRNLATSALLLPVAAVGVRLGVWASGRISKAWFFRLVWAGTAISGLKLLSDGLRG